MSNRTALLIIALELASVAGGALLYRGLTHRQPAARIVPAPCPFAT